MRFLIIDDDPDYRQLLRYHLEVEWPDAAVEEWQPVAGAAELAGLEVAGLDLILLGSPLGREVD